MDLPRAFQPLHGGQCMAPLVNSSRFPSGQGVAGRLATGTVLQWHLHTPASFNTSGCSEVWGLPPEGSSGVKVTAGDIGLAAKLLGQKNVYPVWYNPSILHVSPCRGGF